MVITIDSAFEKDKNQYPQVFLKESKYIENEKKKKKKNDYYWWADDILIMS